jgi:alkylation response protein AidB-like acyl-CoA dehydrogenase
MQVELSHEQAEARHRFREFVEKRITPFAGQWDKEGRIPSCIIRDLKEQGYLAAPAPKEAGGTGMELITYGLLTEEIARGCSSVRSLLTVHDMVTLSILRWGSSALKEVYAAALVNGSLIGALALSEPTAGSDTANIAMEARADGDQWVLTGRKSWITFGQIADLFLVIARSGKGLSAFAVPANTPGLTKQAISVAGTRASLLANIHFNECRVPAAYVVGKIGFAAVQAVPTALDHGRYSVAWGCVGIAQACLDASLDYSSKRMQFGGPIAKHQLIQRKLSDMIVNTRAARLLCYRAGYLRQANSPEALGETMIAKYFASKTATKAANDAVQVHGANGFTDEYPVMRLLRDAKVMEVIEGSTQIQQIAIATCPPKEM